MRDRMSNLPPGVTDSMIPGNRPEDVLYEKLWDDVLDLLGNYEVNVDAEDANGNKLIDHQPFVDAIDEVVVTLVGVRQRFGMADEDARYDR